MADIQALARAWERERRAEKRMTVRQARSAADKLLMSTDGWLRLGYVGLDLVRQEGKDEPRLWAPRFNRAWPRIQVGRRNGHFLEETQDFVAPTFEEALEKMCEKLGVKKMKKGKVKK